MTAATAYLLVDVAGTACALQRAGVREILPLPHLWRPPTAPAALAGFMSLAGEAVPVLDLAVLFGLAAPDSGAPSFYRHLVLLAGAAPLALLVDRVSDLVQVAPDRIRPVAEGAVLNGCVAEEIRIGDGLVHGLSADRILLADERSRLADATRDAQTRIAAWAA